MNLSYTTEYFPNLDELTQQQLDDARAFVVQKLREKFTDVDLSPGTVTGDKVVAPLSEFLAAADLAFSRFMSDLDLGNVADGVIYSCPFVEGFLGNFSVYDDSNLQSVGVVRLTFSADEEVTFARNVVFRFGSSNDFYIRFTSEHGELFTILPSDSVPTADDDKLVLVQTSETTWSVDIPVTGAMDTDVSAGASGVINKVYPTLTGIVAVADFVRGSTPTSLPELARVARKIYHSMSASSRHGIRSSVYHHWPETVMVSPILPNDQEMMRGAPGTALALPDSAVDVYFRSSRDLHTIKQLVKLSYTAEAMHDGLPNCQRFRGKLPFLHSPSKIRSITPYGVTDSGAILSATVYSRPTGVRIPYGMHFGTRYEEFYIDIDPAIDQTLPVIPRFAEYTTSGTIAGYYAMFEVEYEADPLLKYVAAHLESPDQAAAGVSTVVRAGPLVDIDTMTIYYHRRPGVKMLLNPAKEKIVEYARGSGFPEVFTPAAIHDIMKVAGASLVATISVTGKVSVTPAHRWMTYDPDFALPDNIDDDWYRESYAKVEADIEDLADLNPSVVQVHTVTNGNGITQGQVTVMTKRTVRYRIDPAGINFIELA